LAELLPKLRLTLDFMPSPSEEHPGLFIRDPYKFSDAMLVIPPVLVECLENFDGAHTDLDLKATLVRVTNSFDVSEIQQHLTQALSSAGFLEDEVFEQLQRERRTEFAANPVREAAHAGAAYPDEPGELRETMVRYMTGAPASAFDGNLLGLAAPHVSPEGGWESYRAAYSVLRPEHRDKTFVILATSHYGEPERFGLTRKNFRTPLGEARADRPLVDWLAGRGGKAVDMEDYCFSFEHTVEFQVLFLQHVLGPDVKILPVLCGPFARSLYQGGDPEDDDGVKRFFDSLTELHERERDKLVWVLGVDMAHMGARYGDRFEAVAHRVQMAEVSHRDRARVERINSGDAAGFWDLVRENRDDLKWCGSAPFYTFLRSIPALKGELLSYEQWNIDESSVVSFAGMAFTQSSPTPGPPQP
jgi:AmmeMemoRadiSam system protein B